jgi:hypothetical protein
MEDKLKADHAELILVWKWYKGIAHREKSDSDWTQIGEQATRMADSFHTELGKLLVNAALTALNREGRE